ncbi:hypothetical protein SEEM841_17126 [Salmonella enterica subsp. enterica serovar Senftenberg str. 423984-1]|nr:hypothetical protein SEEM841_17126 [Salmonella enterica subsp. enterica serovar Senftenberg str. 423984-1]
MHRQISTLMNGFKVFFFDRVKYWASAGFDYFILFNKLI